MRVTLVAKRAARAHRIEVINQLRHLVVCGPDPVGERLEGLSTIMVVNTPAAMRPRPTGDIAADTTTRTVVELARRARQLGGHAKILDARLNDLVAPLALELLARPGIGADTAAVLLVAAGDNPDRIDTEAVWVHLCGAAPIPASSANTVHHRLNRGRNQQANHALWQIALWCMGADQRTRTYVARRLGDRKNKQEIMRCLNTYIARETYKLLPFEDLA